MKTLLLLLLAFSASALDVTATLKTEEGLRLKAYKCTEGHWTIGYGHRCSIGHAPITQQEAEALLVVDIEEARIKACRLVPFAPREVQEIVTCMVFQIGFAGVSKFERMLEAIDVKEYYGASIEMLDSKWAKQTPTRAKRMASFMADVSRERTRRQQQSW